MRKAEFWWASIHGADPEPVERTEHDGRPCVYTCGCADPFYLDEEPHLVRFISPGQGSVAFGVYKAPPLRAMERPMHPDKEEAAVMSRYRSRIERARVHGWRGPR